MISLVSLIFVFLGFMSHIESRTYQATLCTGISVGFRPAIFDNFIEVKYREATADFEISHKRLQEFGVYAKRHVIVQNCNKKQIIEDKLSTLWGTLKKLPVTGLHNRDLYGLDTLVTFQVDSHGSRSFEWANKSDANDQFAEDPNQPEITEAQRNELEKVIESLKQLADTELKTAQEERVEEAYPFSLAYGKEFLNIQS